LKPIEERHNKQLTKLHNEIGKLADEASKLRTDQVVERQQNEAKMNQLEKTLKDEFRLLEDEKNREINRLADEKRRAYEDQMTGMTTLLRQMHEDSQENNKAMREMMTTLAERRTLAEQCQIL